MHHGLSQREIGSFNVSSGSKLQVHLDKRLQITLSIDKTLAMFHSDFVLSVIRKIIVLKFC